MEKFKKSLVLILLIALIIPVSLTSCKDEDDDEPTVKECIVNGNWNLKSIGTENTTTLSTMVSLALSSGTATVSYDFESDGTYSLVVMGQTIVSAGKWTISEDESTLTLDGTITVKINSANESSLVLVYEEGSLDGIFSIFSSVLGGLSTEGTGKMTATFSSVAVSE